MRECITVKVRRPYTVVIGKDLAQEIVQQVQSYQERGVALILDAKILARHTEFIKTAFNNVPYLKLIGSERIKSIRFLDRCYHFLAKNNMHRDSILYVVGGGTVGDLGGLAAATYMRGIGYYHIPTNLMAMVDSAIGGKTSINLKNGKNLIGAFHQPLGVFSDLNFLSTLSRRQFLSGLSEIIKYALIQDKSFFDWLSKLDYPLEQGNLLHMIKQCAILKSHIVEEDEYEDSLLDKRILLNFGHTFGHALETASRYKEYLHGEAVAIGLYLATQLSYRLGFITEEELLKVKSLLKKMELPIHLKKPILYEDIKNAMKLDKKNKKGRVRFIGLQGIGHGVVLPFVNEEIVKKIWQDVGAMV